MPRCLIRGVSPRVPSGSDLCYHLGIVWYVLQVPIAFLHKMSQVIFQHQRAARTCQDSRRRFARRMVCSDCFPHAPFFCFQNSFSDGCEAKWTVWGIWLRCCLLQRWFDMISAQVAAMDAWIFLHVLLNLAFQAAHSRLMFMKGVKLRNSNWTCAEHCPKHQKRHKLFVFVPAREKCKTLIPYELVLLQGKYQCWHRFSFAQHDSRVWDQNRALWGRLRGRGKSVVKWY